MDNHYHLLIETPDGNLSIGMRQLNGVYTQLFNRRHQRAGHLFQGRYKAILIQKDSHLLEVCRYVVLNPVRARMTERPEAWKWSSYLATAGREAAHPCLTIDWVQGQFSRTRTRAEQEYRKFISWGIGKETIWRDVKGQSILGEDEFVESLLPHISKHQDIPEIPRSHRFATRPGLEKIFTEAIVSDKSKRNRKIIDAVQKYGYTQQQVAAHLRMHYSTISNLVRGKA
jgi:putative transposase